MHCGWVGHIMTPSEYWQLFDHRPSIRQLPDHMLNNSRRQLEETNVGSGWFKLVVFFFKCTNHREEKLFVVKTKKLKKILNQVRYSFIFSQQKIWFFANLFFGFQWWISWDPLGFTTISTITKTPKISTALLLQRQNQPQRKHHGFFRLEQWLAEKIAV